MELPSKDKSQLETVVLHPNGGSALIVGNKRFVVSRDILKVTSDYFKTLFDPSKFKEGRDRNIDILLHEDDPEAMEIMLSILHYRHQESYNQLSPEMLLKVAQHCDKYLCTERMQPRAFRWMQHISEDESIQYYENLSKVAHLFKSVDCLIAISTVAIRSLPPHFGAANTEDEIDGLLFPFHEGSSYRIEIDMEIKNRRAEIGQLLESTTTILRNTSSQQLVAPDVYKYNSG
ncbi:BTB/POZ domain-containing protein [Pochonia chlamydosporia 170]|uniref:BTB/POZ domain-containing protein n=1 Tax=Pochonia chlamydosporia 170 TaxID=1380566 RepID=A0A179F029_METCM|nr:BTB/POZ domain-containing protein [Pochonia chlamydosporia 170]OAQ58805.2 BTB/POZ domain-containing protein [Pochonia chlamydosporia 170]